MTSDDDEINSQQSENGFEGDVEAIREALADMEAGDTGVPLEVFLAEFCQRHGLEREA